MKRDNVKKVTPEEQVRQERDSGVLFPLVNVPDELQHNPRKVTIRREPYGYFIRKWHNYGSEREPDWRVKNSIHLLYDEMQFILSSLKYKQE